MKKILIMLLPAIMLGIGGCEKTNDNPSEKGEIEFVLNSGNTSLKSTPNDTIPATSWHLLLTVTDRSGVPVFEDEMLDVYQFGDGFMSEKLKIESGSFKLTKFMLIDPSGKVMYAAPVEGSPRSYLVNNPLPTAFSVSPGGLTTLSPEVLSVTGAVPSEFGYVSFGMRIVNPLEVHVVVMLDNPLIMAPTQITDAKVLVSSEGGWFHEFYLERKVNQIHDKRRIGTLYF